MKRLILICICILLPFAPAEANRIISNSIVPADYPDKADLAFSNKAVEGNFSDLFVCLEKASILHVMTTGNDETGDGTEANPFATVQHAINIAADGDTAIVHEGVYLENIYFSGHNVIVSSLAPITGDTSYVTSTIIDGSSSGSIISFEQGENSVATITGFTLRNGAADSGGGIFILNSSPTVSNNIIIGNTGNYFGGGIYCGDSSYPEIINNVFKDNYAAYGGAICCRDFSDAHIQNNEFINNTAFYGGGGLYCYYSHISFINNTVVSNDAGYYAGGIALVCSNPNIRNSIIRDNMALYGSQLFGTVDRIYYCNIAGGWSGLGNIDVNPLFIDPVEENYNLCAQSPCIDMGDPVISDPDSTRSDMGRYYAYRPHCDYGRAWFVSTRGNDITGDGSSANPFGTIQNAINVAISLDSVIVDTGIYYENLSIRYNNLFLTSNYIFSGNSMDIRNTIIDGNSAGPVISYEGCRGLAAITGFTIRNGSAQYGGGINCDFSNPTIAHSAIIENTAQMHGGGIYLNYSDPYITNCTITKNRARHFAGGMLCENSVPVITNSIFWNDSAGMTDEIFSYPDSPLISCSDIGDGWPGAGNIDADPLFRNPDIGDFFIHESSPCAPANNSCNVLMGAFDLYFDFTYVVENEELLPFQYRLSQNYPNPFNPATTINYSIPLRTHVDISIYNLLGRRLKTIAEGMKDGGDHSVIWDGTDENGIPAATGVYMYRLKAGDYIETRKMLLLK